MSAFLFLQAHIDKRIMHRDLAIAALAAQGEGKTIQEQLNKWGMEI